MIRQIERDDHPLLDDILDLQRSSLAWVCVAMIVVAIGILCVGAGEPRIGTPRIWLVVGSLAAVVGVSRLLEKHAYALSALILNVGIVVIIAASAMIYSSPDVLFAIPLVIFLSPVLVGYLPTVAITIGTGALVGYLQRLGLVPMSDGAFLTIELLSASSVGFAWIAYRPIEKALHWAWTSSLEERRKTREVRERQAELARVSKSLVEACERLEEANLALARAQQAAEEARRLKEEFATAISHELRTPLNLIIGFSEMIVREPTVDEGGSVPADFHDDVETIYRNACHLSDLVDDVLDLGRLDAHRLALQKEWSSLASVVNDGVTAVESLYRMADLPLVVDVPADLPLLYVDPTRVRQVLINLLTNAIRYTDVGSVRVSARRDRGEVVVSVTDTGAGIPAADLPYVFEGFRQAGQPHRQGGFGIGLTVCKRLVEMHAGAMWVASEQGQGTTFSFSLPVTDNVAAVAAQPSLDLLNRHYLRGSPEHAVLVIGSDHEAVRVFQRYLDGYRVQVAANLPQARQIVAQRPVEAVVVADPRVSVDEALELAANSQVPNAPVLRCLLRTVTVSGREAGAAAFLTKPVSRDRLGDALAHLERPPQHVVILDDEPAMTALLQRMLQTIVPDCRVTTASNGKQGMAIAKEAAQRDCLDLVLLDLVMPEMDGWGFLAEWSADPKLRTIPVVIISAANEESHDIVAKSSLEVCGSGGLTVAHVMRTVRASLDCLLGVETVAET